MTYGVPRDDPIDFCSRGHYLPDNTTTGSRNCSRCKAIYIRQRRGGLKVRIQPPAFVGDDPLPCTASPDPEVFFPDANDYDTLRLAEAICARCPVRERCLEWALTLPQRDDHGVLGGTSAIERRRIRYDRKAAS